MLWEAERTGAHTLLGSDRNPFDSHGWGWTEERHRVALAERLLVLFTALLPRGGG